jgi:hypothetical protein
MSKLVPPKGTKKVGILFGDNDFHSTFRGFLQALLFAVSEDRENGLPLTKAKVVDLFNETSYGFYLMNQHRWRFDDADANAQRTKDYLKIVPEQVYIDDEVDALLSENPWHNGEFFAVDFTNAFVWSA